MTVDREWIPRSDAPQIAQRLRERREASGMTHADVARKAGVAKSTYVHWERGRVPDTLAAATVTALEAALQVPPGWLLSQGTQPLPAPGVDAVAAANREGAGDLLARIPLARCPEVGAHAGRLRGELGLSVAEVARACDVSRSTLLQWERGAFPKALTAQRLHAWERALLLAPGQLLAPPAPHPMVIDGRWRVVIEAQTLEAAIHRVAGCLATHGRNLVTPGQPMERASSRNADLLAYRYGIGAYRGSLVDVAVAYGMAATDVRKAMARLIERAARFAFEIPVLNVIEKAGAADLSSTTTVAGDRIRDLLGPSLSMERAAAFASEILSRQIAGAELRMGVACASIRK
ncbi:helix-turn-helix transcriptional regulator [Paraburkholderia sp. A3BS-1L]|uniref:helix-turn-helix domain-containing protein n=1 Tax=Paraburkholderia sp. A3BS-1L TaxID=3028375 RepID=UPI003DA978B6